MRMLSPPPPREEVVYPESDGKPIADNTLQFEWISTIKGGLDALFRDRSDVFVAGDLLWYPVEGDPRIRAAPDVMVVFGRPKGHRGSYIQHVEEGIAPQVVFEVLSPGNRASELVDKSFFYQRYGVEEYYIYDPDHGTLSGLKREDGELNVIPNMEGWISPRLGVRFGLARGDLQLTCPDGTPFATYVELARQRDAEHTRAEQERARAERLAARLRELGIDPEE